MDPVEHVGNVWNASVQNKLSRRSLLGRTAGLTLSSIMAGSLLAACGGGDDEDEETSSTATTAPDETGDSSSTVTAAAPVETEEASSTATTTPEDTDDASSTATQPASGSSSSGGTLTTAMEADPITIDPAYTSSLPGRRIGRAIFDPLVDLDEQGQLVPVLAESWEQPDDQTYVLQLREGVTFHDGTAFDAEAVKFHFDRHLNPENQSLRRGELLAVESVEILDSHSVQINLTEPFAPFLYALFDWSGFIVSPTAVEEQGESFGSHPVGTGPFRMVEYIQDQHAIVERNPDYWNPERPLLDEIIFRPISLGSSRLTELRSGGVQIAEDLPYQDIERLRSDSSIVISEKQGFRFEFLAFQTEEEPYGSNRTFRQVLNWALDREAIHQAIYFGTGSIGYDPFLPGSPFYDPDYQPFTRDLDRARQLLEESGVPSPAEFTVYIGQDSVVQGLAQIIQSNYSDVGVTMNIENTDDASLTARLVESDFTLYIGRWWGYRPDPDQYLSTLVHSEGSNNYSHYSNPELDRLLEQARSVSDIDERRDLYRQISPIINEDAANIYFHSGSNFKGLTPNVQGFVHMQDSIVRYKDISLEDE